MPRKQNYQPALIDLDPLDKRFHDRQVYRAKVANMSFEEIAKELLWLKANEPKRTPRPKSIPPGASWTTREAAENMEKQSIVMSYMTRQELRQVLGE